MRFWSYIFPGLYGLLVYVTIRLVTDVPSGEYPWERSLIQNIVEVIFTVTMGYVFHWVLVAANKRLARLDDFSMNRIVWELLLIAAVILVVVNPVVILIHYLVNDYLSAADVVIANCITILFSLLYYSMVRGNFMLRSYISQQQRMNRLQNDQLQTELKFLKAQYHPHFLFNALNTIYFQMDGNVSEAKRTLEQFSHLLRYQLYDQQKEVKLGRELEHLGHYIELQRTRVSDKLNLELRFDEGLNEWMIYPLLLLPLVENAFKYVGGNYRIGIEAKREGDKLRFTVINSLPSEAPAFDAGGIGLENTRRRLELLYPGRHTLLVCRKENEFFAELQISLT